MMTDKFEKELDEGKRLTTIMIRVQSEEIEKLIKSEELSREDYIFWKKYLYADEISRSEKRKVRDIHKIIWDLLEKNPESMLRILKANRDFSVFFDRPPGNTIIYGFFHTESGNFDINPSTYEHDKDWNNLEYINELNHSDFPDGRLFVKINSSIGILNFGKHKFRLYGKLDNAEINDSKPFPFKRLTCSENEAKIENPFLYEIDPYFMLVGDRISELCSERLIYIEERFPSSTESFKADLQKIIRYRANNFAAFGFLRDKGWIKSEQEFMKLEQRIAEFEKTITYINRY